MFVSTYIVARIFAITMVEKRNQNIASPPATSGARNVNEIATKENAAPCVAPESPPITPSINKISPRSGSWINQRISSPFPSTLRNGPLVDRHLVPSIQGLLHPASGVCGVRTQGGIDDVRMAGIHLLCDGVNLLPLGGSDAQGAHGADAPWAVWQPCDWSCCSVAVALRRVMEKMFRHGVFQRTHVLSPQLVVPNPRLPVIVLGPGDIAHMADVQVHPGEGHLEENRRVLPCFRERNLAYISFFLIKIRNEHEYL